MSRVDDLKAKGKMLAGGPAQPVPTPRTEPFRLSVDLPPMTHDELQRWVAATGSELGRRIPAARVVRVLLQRMFTDEDLHQAVIQDLRAL